MALIGENQVPWKELSEKKDIAQSKLEFLQNIDEQIPPIFRGIRKYIKECYNTKYEAKPKYSELRNLIEKSFSNEDEALKIIIDISKDIMRELIRYIIKENIENIIN